MARSTLSSTQISALMWTTVWPMRCLFGLPCDVCSIFGDILPTSLMMTCCLLVVGALCLAHSLADLGEANIIAIVHDTGLDSGVGGISAINHFYGRPDIPIGAYRGPVGRPSTSEKPAWVHKGRGVYVDDLVASFPVGGVRTAKDVPSALEVYRSVLGAAPDRSVTVVSIVRPPPPRAPYLQPSPPPPPATVTSHR